MNKARTSMAMRRQKTSGAVRSLPSDRFERGSDVRGSQRDQPTLIRLLDVKANVGDEQRISLVGDLARLHAPSTGAEHRHVVARLFWNVPCDAWRA